MENKTNFRKLIPLGSIFKITVTAILTITIAVVMIFDGKQMTEAAENAILLCLNTIIPSLFGYMVISGFLIRSGIHKIIFAPLYYVLRLFIHVTEEEFSIILLSIFGGYPVGGKLIADRNNMERLLPYSYCGSPVFIMTIVGLRLYGNGTIGLYVYLANALSCLIAALILNIKRPVPKMKRFKIKDIKINRNVFLSSVESAAGALLTVCSMIIVFALLLETFRYIFETPLSALHPTVYGTIFSFGEISNIVILPKYNINLLPFISLLTSFGGCCIIMQIAAVTKGKISLIPFILARIPIGILSFFICHFLLKLIEPEIAVATSTNLNVAVVSGNPIASFLLIIMSLILLNGAKSNKLTILSKNQKS